MSERGVFAVDRGVFDHPIFAREPFSEREAWIWLVGAAAWRAHRVRVGGRTVELKRGQCAFSVRFLAERWSWSKSRVDRFLGRLEIETMIGTQSGTGTTVITICNYDEYQKVSLPDRDTDETSDGTGAGQERDKEEDIKNIKSPSLRSGERTAAFSRGTRLPADWVPDQAGQEFAVKKLGSLDAAREEFAKFRDYWNGQPGRAGVKTDWPGTWRNWCRNALRFNGKRAPPAVQKSFEEIADDLMRGSHAAVDDNDAVEGGSRTFELDFGGGVSVRR